MTRNHKRNVSGLRTHAQKKHEDATRRAEEAIRLLVREGRPVNFNTVSEVGHVSAAWLYKQTNLRARIEHLRGEATPKVGVPRRQRASDDSKNKIIAALRDRAQRAEAEVARLKDELKVVYGRLAAAGLV